MYAKISNGTVVEYPYSVKRLQKDNPNTSFPRKPSDTLLAEWGVYPVVNAERPQVDHTKNVVEGTPDLVEGVWVQVWDVTDATAAEIADRTLLEAMKIRRMRDSMLANTDWRILRAAESGNSVDPAWAAYRQALRDITDQAAFPWAVTWPPEPE